MTQKEQYRGFAFAYRIDSDRRSAVVTPKDFAQKVSTLRNPLKRAFLEQIVVQRDDSEPETFTVDKGLDYLRSLRDGSVRAMHYSAHHTQRDAFVQFERPVDDTRLIVSARSLPSHLYETLVSRIKKSKKDWSVTPI